MKASQYPCPICKNIMTVIGTDSKGKKIGSCGHAFRFKKTRSQKDIDRGYVRTEWGLEKVS